MNGRRRLTLRREMLTDLGGGQLRAIAGGTHVPTDCACGITHGFSCEVCPLPTLPVNSCGCGTYGAVGCPVGSQIC